MSGRIVAGTLMVGAGFAIAIAFAWGERPAADAQGTKIAPKRKPWTTSQVTGSPEPPPKYKSVRAFPNVKFNHPLLIARCPGSDRLFVGEQDGVLYSFANKPDAKAELFFDLKRRIKTIDKLAGAKGVGELYGLVFHPKFEENRYCFVCYTLTAKTRPKAGHLPDGTRVSRFTVTKTDPPRIDPASEEIVLTFVRAAGTTAATCTSAPTACSTSPPATPRPEPARPAQHRAGHLRPALVDPAHRRGPARTPARTTPSRRTIRSSSMKDVRPEIWAYRLPQSVADELRPPDRRAVGRRRRLGAVGDGPPGREGRQLRLVHHGRAAADQAGPEDRPDADPPAADRAAAHDRVQRHRRLRLSRQEVPGAGRGVHLRRLGNAAHLGRPVRGRPAARRCRRSSSRPCASSPSARTTPANSTSSTTTPG